MYEALNYQIMLDEINRNVREKGVLDDTVGILITGPELPTGKDILSSLEYYHFRTGNSVNFYLPGYGAYWGEKYDDQKTVTTIDNIKWYFSNKMFVQFVSELEQHTKWKYSGESELLLVDIRQGILSYNSSMQFYLDSMLRDGVIESVNLFFESLFRMCRNQQTMEQISNSFGMDKVKQMNSDALLANLPLGLGKLYTQEKYFCVKNMEK